MCAMRDLGSLPRQPYSLKKNEIRCSNVGGPEIIIPSEVSQTEKDKYPVISRMCGI